MGKCTGWGLCGRGEVQWGGGGGESLETRREGKGRPANEAEVKMCAEFPVCRNLTKITQPHKVKR